MIREEGHYTIKRVEKLPKNGNANLLYALKTTELEKFYRWLPNHTYEEINVGGSGSPTLQGLQSVLDTGNSAQSTDTFSRVKLDLQDAGNGDIDLLINAGVGIYSQVQILKDQVYIANQSGLQYSEISQYDGTIFIEQGDPTGNFYSDLYFRTPISNNSLHLPAPATNLNRTLALSVNSILADSEGNIVVPAADSLIILTDTPSSYTGQAGKILAVNVGEDAVEFVDAPTEILTHFQAFQSGDGVDTTVVASTNFTITPTFTNGVKIISLEINGYLVYDLTNGNVKDLNDVDGVNYSIEILQRYWLETGSSNFTLNVTNGTNDLVQNQINVRLMYIDEVVPGGK